MNTKLDVAVFFAIVAVFIGLSLKLTGVLPLKPKPVVEMVEECETFDTRFGVFKFCVEAENEEALQKKIEGLKNPKGIRL